MMTKREAFLFLRHSAEDDLEEVWEQLLFMQKQYFLTHAPTPLVWESKLKRLLKKYRAYLVLTDREDIEEKDSPNFSKKINFSDHFIDAFNEFHKLRNQHKSEVLQSQSFFELSDAVMRWLNTELEYAFYWSHPMSKELDIKVFLSKEPDPMQMLKDLKGAKSLLGETSIMGLKNNYNNLDENIKKEVKRLTLLSKS